MILALADYHVIRNVEISAGMARFVDYLPSGLRIGIAPREEPELPIAKLRVRAEVTDIGPDDPRSRYGTRPRCSMISATWRSTRTAWLASRNSPKGGRRASTWLCSRCDSVPT